MVAPAGSSVAVPTITLRVPGNWPLPRELSGRLAGGGYAMSLSDRPDDFALVDDATGQRYPLGVVGPDAEVADLFADGGRLNDPESAALRDHDVKVSVSGPGGSVDAARRVLRAGAALVRAGGVFVDNCGSTHSPRVWLELAGDDGDGGVYWALVELTGVPDLMYSTGMHCLGHPDAELPDPADPGRGVVLHHSLFGYSYRAGVTLHDGEMMVPPGVAPASASASSTAPSTPPPPSTTPTASGDANPSAADLARRRCSKMFHHVPPERPRNIANVERKLLAGMCLRLRDGRSTSARDHTLVKLELLLRLRWFRRGCALATRLSSSDDKQGRPPAMRAGSPQSEKITYFSSGSVIGFGDGR